MGTIACMHLSSDAVTSDTPTAFVFPSSTRDYKTMLLSSLHLCDSQMSLCIYEILNEVSLFKALCPSSLCSRSAQMCSTILCSLLSVSSMQSPDRPQMESLSVMKVALSTCDVHPHVHFVFHHTFPECDVQRPYFNSRPDLTSWAGTK